MANQNVVVLKGAEVRVVTAVSQKGNAYKAFECEVNGKVIRLGFVSAQNELALLKAGVVID